jgi:hypothetical protein
VVSKQKYDNFPRTKSCSTPEPNQAIEKMETTATLSVLGKSPFMAPSHAPHPNHQLNCWLCLQRRKEITCENIPLGFVLLIKALVRLVG